METIFLKSQNNTQGPGLTDGATEGARRTTAVAPSVGSCLNSHNQNECPYDTGT